jgi:5-methylcytosine-specific restriction protein A
VTYAPPGDRGHMTNARAARIFLAAGGRCHICGNPIRDGEKWDKEHVVPLSMGGADDDANLRPAHIKCHKAKTGTEAGQRADRNRTIARGYAAARKPKSRFKRKVDGTVVLREAE